VRIAAAPEGGRANDELVRLLASVLGVSERSVSIVAGRHSRSKVVAVDGVDPQEVERLLEAASRST
jgi:uncharacterized protein YggU (UPF0235/DUF167 family)